MKSNRWSVRVRVTIVPLFLVLATAQGMIVALNESQPHFLFWLKSDIAPEQPNST